MDSAPAEDAESSMESTAANNGDYSQTNLQEVGVDEGDIVKLTETIFMRCMAVRCAL